MPMGWVGPLISGAALVLVAIIEAVAARERKRIKADNQKSDALMNGVQALLRGGNGMATKLVEALKQLPTEPPEGERT